MSTALSLSSSIPLPAKTSSKSKPVNVFSNDGSFLERFQRSKQEEEDRRKAEEALAKKKRFADRFKNRGKRPPPPDSSTAVTSTDLDPNPTKKKPKLEEEEEEEEVPLSAEYRNGVFDDTGTGVRPSVV